MFRPGFVEGNKVTRYPISNENGVFKRWLSSGSLRCIVLWEDGTEEEVHGFGLRLILNPHFVSDSCSGEPCAVCYRQGISSKSSHKVGEEIPFDDPNPNRHNLTAYVCCIHFRELLGGTCKET